MIEVFKINMKHQVKSISNGFGLLLVLPTVVPLLLYFNGEARQLLEIDFYIFMFGFALLFFLPALYFHITYYITNKDTILEIDKVNQAVTIVNKESKRTLHHTQFKQVIRVIYSDFKHPKRQQNWQPVPWRNYGYLKLVTFDDEVFLLTSLLLDPSKPPIRVTETQYNYFPDLDATVYKESTHEELAIEQREVIENFKQKFMNYSQEELLVKTKNYGFKKEAVLAAQELLKEKFACQQST